MKHFSNINIYKLITFILLFPFFLNAQDKTEKSLFFTSDWPENQQQLFISNLEPFPKNTQVSIAVIEGGKTKYIGIKNDDGHLVNIDNSKKAFEIGSITKVFTSTLFAQAILDGSVTAETRLDNFLEYPLKDNKAITLLQLSNHTSGLSRMPMNFMFAQQKDPDNPYIHYDEALLKDWLTKYMNPGPSNEKSEYSNLGAALLAHALTIHYDYPFIDLLKDKIFTPLKMKSSTTAKAEVEDILIEGLKADGTPAKNWEFDVLAGAGAILSTVSDLELFARAILKRDNEALNLQLASTFKVNDNFEMGMGWHIIKGKGGNVFYWHNGGTNGYTSSMLLDPKRKKAVIMLSNISAFHTNMGNVDNLVFELMKTLK